MKPLLLLIITLLLVLPIFGQKIEIGINAGITNCNIQKRDGGSPFRIYGWTNQMTPNVSVKGIRVTKHWDFGFSVDYYGYSMRSNGPFYFNSMYLSGIFSSEPSENIRTSTDYCVPFKLFVNRKIDFKRFEIYAGVSAGYIVRSDMPLFDMRYGNSYTAGLQSGAAYHVTKRIGVNLNLAYDYLVLTSRYMPDNTMIAIPATLGVRYKL